MRYYQSAAADELRAFQARQAGRVVENGRRVGRFGAAGIGRALGGNALRTETVAGSLGGGIGLARLFVGGWGLLFYGRIEWLTGQVEALRPDGVFDLAAQLRLRAWIAAMVLLPITCAFGASYSAAVAAAPRGDARRASVVPNAG